MEEKTDKKTPLNEIDMMEDANRAKKSKTEANEVIVNNLRIFVHILQFCNFSCW